MFEKNKIKKKEREPEIDLIDSQGHKQKLEIYGQREVPIEEQKRRAFLIEERQKELDKIEECRLRSIREKEIGWKKQGEFKEKIFSSIKPLLPIAMILGILLISGLFIFRLTTVGLAPSLPGLITINESYDYTDDINLTFNENKEYTWLIDNYGNLKSIRLNGTISKDGSARVYLEQDDNRYLIFDSSRLSREEIETEPIIMGTQDKARTVMDDIFEFKVISEFDQNVDYDKVCTMWELNSELVECYGNEMCCNFGGMGSSGLWDSNFYLSYGRHDSGLQNIIQAQMIYYDVDQSISYSNIVLSDVKEIEAEFYEPVIEFSDICIDTCLLPNFNETSYKLIFEVEDANLTIDNIDYTVEKEIIVSRNPPELVKEFDNITIYKDYDVRIDLSEYFYDEDGEKLTYYSDEVDNISIVIRNNIARIIPDYNFTGKRYIYFKASDSYYNSTSNVFEVNVVEEPKQPDEVDISEESGKPEKVVINQDVKWIKKVTSSDRVINLDIDIHDDALDVAVRDVKNDRIISEDKLKVNDKGSIKTVSSYRAEKGIEQIDKSIERLESKGAELRGKGLIDTQQVQEIESQIIEQGNERNKLERDITEPIEGETSTTTSVIIEDIIEEIEIEYYTEGPISEEEKILRGKRIVVSSDIHYEDIEAYTIIEPETQCSNIALYRIVDNSREKVSDTICYDENNNNLIDKLGWTVPSLSTETYEVIIITKAEHLDSNRENPVDIYDSVRALDDVWSEAINNNEYVRVTFETPLDNKRDITIYPRTVSGEPRIEVYEFNKTEKIAEFTSLNNNEYNKVLLTNLQGKQDVFDLKVVDGAIEIDYIVDPITSISVYAVNPDPVDKDKTGYYAAVIFNPTESPVIITDVVIDASASGTDIFRDVCKNPSTCFPTSGWTKVNNRRATWLGFYTLGAGDAVSFYALIKSNKKDAPNYLVDYRVRTFDGSFYSDSHNHQSTQVSGNLPFPNLAFDMGTYPGYNETTNTNTAKTYSISLEDTSGRTATIPSGVTLTIKIPEFTNLMDSGGDGWGPATINGDTIQVSTTDIVQNSKITYSFSATAPPTKGLYLIDASMSGTNTRSVMEGAIKVIDSCSCPSSGDWHIINGDQCTWDSTDGVCDLGSNKFRVLDGGMSILPGGQIRSGGCFVALNQKLYIDKNGGLYCE